jgi:DNA-binding MarR family transcriptional regulator
LGVLNYYVGYFARRVQIACFKDLIPRLAPWKIRPVQFSILALIEANPGVSPTAIGRTLSVERARMTRLLRIFVERRLTRTHVHSLFLTPKGAKFFKRLKPIAIRNEIHMARLLGQRTSRQLNNILKKWINSPEYQTWLTAEYKRDRPSVPEF